MKDTDVSASWTFRGTRREAIFPSNTILFPFSYFLRFLVPGKRGTRILDVGACVGAFTLPYLTQDPEATTTMIEPSVNALPYLRHNCGDLGEIIEVAASSEEGYATLSNTEHDTKDKQGSVIGTESIHGEGFNAQRVRLVRLDDIINKPMDLMKVDVEGHELDVFRGATRLLKEYRPDLMVELKVGRQRQGGHGRGDVVNFLVRLGYDQPSQATINDFLFTWDKT